MSSRGWGHYTEQEVVRLVHNYQSYLYMKDWPQIHVRLMDLQVAMWRLPNKLFRAVLVYGILQFNDVAAGKALQISHVEVRKRYRHGIQEILYQLNGEE